MATWSASPLPTTTLVGTVDVNGHAASCTPVPSTSTSGRSYRVDTLDLDDGVAVVEPPAASEYTQPRTDTEFTLLGDDARRRAGTVGTGLGAVRVSLER